MSEPFHLKTDPTTSLAWRGFRRWKIPVWLLLMFTAGIVLTWIPLSCALEARTNKAKTEPRIHMVQDMDNQPKFKAQDESRLFLDARAQRPRVPGTVARGELFLDSAYYNGYTEATENGQVTRPFINGYPAQIQEKLNDPVEAAKLLALGELKYNITCSMCHGKDGQGNGPIHVRAVEVGAVATGWVQPNNLSDAVRRARPDGHIYNTINNGIRNMGGYGTQLKPEERWAIVAYVRTLQLAHGVDSKTLPAGYAKPNQ
ncbi:MAG: cytochrome c [Alphaproteobacteria bacterium]|nr:MAG: cytochrome c [Alphaproteobacteria bacterium]